MRKQCVVAAGSLAVLFACLSAALAAERPQVPRALAQLPVATQQTIRSQIGSGKLVSVEKDTEDGEVTYEVEMTRDGKTRSFTVDADGELIDEQMFLAELPGAVQKTIQTQVGKGSLGEIFKSAEDGEVSYDVEMTSAG